MNWRGLEWSGCLYGFVAVCSVGTCAQGVVPKPLPRSSVNPVSISVARRRLIRRTTIGMGRFIRLKRLRL